MQEACLPRNSRHCGRRGKSTLLGSDAHLPWRPTPGGLAARRYYLQPWIMAPHAWYRPGALDWCPVPRQCTLDRWPGCRPRLRLNRTGHCGRATRDHRTAFRRCDMAAKSTRRHWPIHDGASASRTECIGQCPLWPHLPLVMVRGRVVAQVRCPQPRVGRWPHLLPGRLGAMRTAAMLC